MDSSIYEKGLVSVVIPTYNRSTLIERAVDSVLDQSYPSVEILVVDDGSTDDTADRIYRRYRDDRRVRYIRQQNGGVCTARNHGIREAQGEFVAMLDSDDYWLPGKLNLQVSIMNAHPELSLIWTDMDAVNSDGEVVARRYLKTMYSTYDYFPHRKNLFHRELTSLDGHIYLIGDLTWPMVLGNLIHTSTVLARADRLRQAGWYDQACNPAEDQDYYYRVCKTGPVALVDTSTIHYLIGSADAATGLTQGIALSTSHLKVLHSIIDKEGDRIRLPKAMINKALYRGYVWAGRVHFYQGRTSEARRYLLRAVKYGGVDMRSARFMVATFLPGSLLDALRVIKKKWLSGLVNLYCCTQCTAYDYASMFECSDIIANL